MLICNILLGFLNYNGFLYLSSLRQLRNQGTKSLFTAAPSYEETERQFKHASPGKNTGVGCHSLL